MSNGISEAWGLKVGEDVEFRTGPRTKHPNWTRGKVIRFDTDKTIWVRDLETTKSYRLANPRNVRQWRPPTRLEDIEAFLGER